MTQDCFHDDSVLRHCAVR